EIAEAISGITDRDHFLQRLARQIASATNNAWVAIYTRAGHNGALLVRSNTMPNPRPLPARISADPGQMTADVVAYSGVDPTADLITTVPISVDSTLLGALVLYSSSLERLDETDRARLAQIAEEMGPAVAVAEHHHAVKQ